MFQNMTIGKKIIFGFSVITILLVIVGISGYMGLSSSSKGFTEYRMFARETNLAGRVQANMIMARLFAKNYIIQGSEKDQSKFYDRWKQVEEYSAEAKEIITDSQRSDLIRSIEKNQAEYSESFEKVVQYKAERNDLVDGSLNIKGPEIEKKLTEIMTSAHGDKDASAAYNAGLVLRNLLLARLYVVKYLDTNTKSDMERVEDELSELNKLLVVLDKDLQNPHRRSLLKETQALVRDYEEDFQSLVGVITDRNTVIAESLDTIGPIIADQAEQIKLSVMEDQDVLGPKLQAANTRSIAVISITAIIALVAGILFALLITRGINAALKQVIDGLANGSEQVSAASLQVSSSSQQLAEGSSEQASSLEEISSSLEEMTSMTRQNSENARQADSFSQEAKKTAENGAEAMNRMSEAINKIKSSSDETAKIVKTIDEIAFQTNLLALNAAVEAARAGEAGMGFAVVAEEVRNLAQRSAEAAKNTASLIEESQVNADNGVAVSNDVESTLLEIVERVGKVTNLVGEVTAASEEQTQGINQINAAVSQMDQVTQSTAANAEESASASEELSSQAAELNDMVQILSHMVDGDKQGNSSPRPAIAAPRAAAPRIARATVPALPKREPALVKSEDIIPLDDDSFGEF